MPTPKEILEYALMPSGMETTALNGVIANNQDKEFIRRIQSQNMNVSNYIPQLGGGRANFKMGDDGGIVYPNIENIKGKLTPLPRFQWERENINLGNPIAGAWFARNGYKKTNPVGFGLE